MLTAINAGLAWPVYAGLSAASAHLIWQIRTLNILDPKNCAERFKSNKNFGIIVFVAFVLGQLLKEPENTLENEKN